MNGVTVFAPSPVLTVTIETHGREPDIHLHAGGQGVWQARMLATLGAPVTLCAVLGGETGRVLQTLINDEGITLRHVPGSGRNGSYVHDRRGAERAVVAESVAIPLARHELDRLYDLTLSTALDSSAVILSGASHEDIVPAGIYRRLAADLRTTGCCVVADLTGDRLAAALEGGLTVLKISDEELAADGRVSGTEPDDLVKAMHVLHREGAEHVVVSRAAEPALVLADGVVSDVKVPRLEAADSHGSGDSFTAGITAALSRGASFEDAIRLGAAAGTVNVTRHGLGSGDVESVLKVRELVALSPWESHGRGDAQVSPHGLAQRVQDT